MVAAPPEEGTTPSLVTVSGSTVAVKLSVMKLRETDMLVTLRHDQMLQNAITRCGLSSVVSDGKPPLRAAVIKANPTAGKDEIEDYLYDAMEQYQKENATLFDIVYDSIDFSSEWEILDVEHVRTNFVKGAVRDGNGLMQWANSFHDPKSDAIQKRLRADLDAYKLPIETSCAALLKTLLDMLSVWGRITGNDKTSHISLDSFHCLVRDKMATTPAEKPIPRLRAMLADLIYSDNPKLRDTGQLIKEMVRFAKEHGVPENGNPARAAYPVVNGGVPAAITFSKENNCTGCEVYGCTAQDDRKKCATFNNRIDIKTLRPMQQRFAEGGRTYLKEHPTTKSLKGIRLTLPPFPKDGRGASTGERKSFSRGGGRGGVAAAIFDVNAMLGEEPAETNDEQANDCSFEEWLLAEQGHVVAPVWPNFANLFTQEDAEEPPLSQEELLAEAARQTEEQIQRFNTPQVRPRSENPALVQLTPRSRSTPATLRGTPVVNSSLDELRQSSAASGGGIGTSDDSDGNGNTRSRQANAAASDVELALEANIATARVGLNQAKATRKKLEKQKQSITITKVLKSLTLNTVGLVRKGLDKLNWVQLGLLIVVNYYMIWPNIKPTVRSTLARLYKYLLGMTTNARDMVLGTIAERATGAMATGLVLAATSAVQHVNVANNAGMQRVNVTNDARRSPDAEQVVALQRDDGEEDPDGGTPAAAAAMATVLSPIREESTPINTPRSDARPGRDAALLAPPDSHSGRDAAVPAPPAPTLRGRELEINTIPSGESATLSNESQTTADLVITSEELGNSNLVMMLNKANGSDGKRQRAQVHDMSMPPPEARPCKVTTDTSAASQEPQKLAGLSSTLSNPDGPGNEKLSSNLSSPDGQDSTSSNDTLLDNAYSGDCVCDPRSQYVCPPCTDEVEEALLNKPMFSGNTVVQGSARQHLISSGMNIMHPSQARTPRSTDCTACGKPTTYKCTGISASDPGCYRGPCCQPNPECVFCRDGDTVMFPKCAPGSELTLVALPNVGPTGEEQCAQCIANGDPTGENIADFDKCGGTRSQCERTCVCKDARAGGLHTCNGCSVKFCSVHARAKRSGDRINSMAGHTCHGMHRVTQANIVAHLGCNANAVVTSPNMADLERRGPCSECRIPQDSRTPCLLCDQLLCDKCLPQGMHDDCFVVQLGCNANIAVTSPNMADRERRGPCSECNIPQDSLTPCPVCNQLLCEECLPQERHGYCADTLLPLENKRAIMPTVHQVTPNMKCLADVAMTSPNAIPGKVLARRLSSTTARACTASRLKTEHCCTRSSRKSRATALA